MSLSSKINEMKEVINVGVIEATVIMREIKITEGVEIDVDEGLDMTDIVFECTALMCLCIRVFAINFSLYVLHSNFLLFIKDLSLSSVY